MQSSIVEAIHTSNHLWRWSCLIWLTPAARGASCKPCSLQFGNLKNEQRNQADVQRFRPNLRRRFVISRPRRSKASILNSLDLFRRSGVYCAGTVWRHHDDWQSFASMSWASTGWHSGGILFGWLGRCGWEKLPRNKIRIVHIHAKIHRYTNVWVSMDVWRICTTRISCGYHALVMFEQISISICRCILLPVTIWVVIAHQLCYALVWSRHRSWKQSNSINIHPQFCTLGGEFAVILGLVPMRIATNTYRHLCKARSIQLSPIWLCLEGVCSHPFPVITLQSRHDW